MEKFDQTLKSDRKGKEIVLLVQAEIETFEDVVEVVHYKEQRMRIWIAGKRPRCFLCKELGHLQAFCESREKLLSSSVDRVKGAEGEQNKEEGEQEVESEDTEREMEEEQRKSGSQEDSMEKKKNGQKEVEMNSGVKGGNGREAVRLEERVEENGMRMEEPEVRVSGVKKTKKRKKKESNGKDCVEKKGRKEEVNNGRVGRSMEEDMKISGQASVCETKVNKEERSVVVNEEDKGKNVLKWGKLKCTY